MLCCWKVITWKWFAGKLHFFFVATQLKKLNQVFQEVNGEILKDADLEEAEGNSRGNINQNRVSC